MSVETLESDGSFSTEICQLHRLHSLKIVSLMKPEQTTVG